MSQRKFSSSVVAVEDRPLFILICVLMTACFITGGSSQETNIGVAFSQLLALPVLLYALVRLWRCGRTVQLLPAFAVLALIVLVPLLQLLPIPHWLWSMPSWRTSLERDLIAAGVTRQQYLWTLTPAATERALWSLVPAVALFLATLSLHRDNLRRLVWLLVGLALFNLVLAVAQLGAPQDSFLNPYPTFAPSMGGIFANHNHQATSLGLALVLSMAIALDPRPQRSLEPHSSPLFQKWLFAALAFLFAAALPMVGSRAGVLVAIVPALLIVGSSGGVPYRRLRTHRPTQLMLLAGAALLAIFIFSAFSWIQSESNIENQRWTFNVQTSALALVNSPLGSGMGSFVPLFQQGSEIAARMDTIVNHTHDEYPQWWLEGGLLAMFAVLAAFAVWAGAVRALTRLPTDSSLRVTGISASMAILVIALHSTVDYPLRTPAVMAMFGLLAGIAMTAAAQARERLMMAAKRYIAASRAQ